MALSPSNFRRLTRRLERARSKPCRIIDIKAFCLTLKMIYTLGLARVLWNKPFIHMQIRCLGSKNNMVPKYILARQIQTISDFRNIRRSHTLPKSLIAQVKIRGRPHIKLELAPPLSRVDVVLTHRQCRAIVPDLVLPETRHLTRLLGMSCVGWSRLCADHKAQTYIKAHSLLNSGIKLREAMLQRDLCRYLSIVIASGS